MTTEVTGELDAADELERRRLELHEKLSRVLPFHYAAVVENEIEQAFPAEPKLHDDMTLADWKRAFANYDRKPWQS